MVCCHCPHSHGCMAGSTVRKRHPGRLKHPPWMICATKRPSIIVVSVIVVILAHIPAVVGVETSGLVCQQDKCSMSFTIPENISVDSYVGTVGGSSGVSPPFLAFIPSTSDGSTADATQAFRVNLDTGQIFIKAPLDRETNPNGYAFVLTTVSKPVVIEVTLQDVNDNSPVFRPDRLTLEFSESAPVGTKKPLGSVTDPDLGENSTRTCEIVSGNIDDAFSLQQQSSGFDIILDLRVNSQLDYELHSSYLLIIRAMDGGGRTGEMQVNIKILDQNDNQPIFNTSKYEVQIAENVTVGTKIIQVQATDQDSELNGKIRYSIDRKTDPENRFSIDANTGDVRVVKPLDYETQPTYRLKLEATDYGSPPLAGNAALDVKLVNINEQPANINLVFLQGADRQGHIPENTEKGTPVARISVDDPDMTVDLKVHGNITLLGGDGVFGLQITDGVISLIVVNTPPDREQKASYDLTVIVTDSGNPPLRASESFTVYIDDVNDNAPVFTMNPYRGEVQETAGIGTSVLQVNATDADDGENARIHYSIQPSTSPQSGWFTIDSNTGVITTNAAIDCEVNSQPSFVVVAQDSGDQPRSGSTLVMISVRDVNDKQPEFETSFYNARVPEDARVGECILQVHAVDPECGTSPVTYQLARSADTPPEFIVQEGTGRICIQQPLDYERNATYQFLVQAVDREGLTASAVVYVLVKDVNDNSPYFEPLRYSLNVESAMVPGPLLTVQAADLDSGINGTVTYSFVNDNTAQGLFTIDAGSGTISLTRSFPPATNRVYQLSVQGRDGGGLLSPQAAQVNISVYSGDLHPPVFTLTMYNFTVLENVPIGSRVGRVEATMSSGSTGIVYTIQYASRNWFRMDSRTGEIFTAAQLDRETQPSVLLTVQAQSPQPLYSMAQANFTLLDVNDNSPVFPAFSVQTIEVREESLRQDPVYIAHAVDVDAGNNGSVMYRLANDFGGLFAINQVSGELYLRDTLDYEKTSKYSLQIVAEDQGTDVRRNASLTLTVNVKDVNDNPPVFTQSVYDFYVSEDVYLGYTFGLVNATDIDSDNNGRVSYSLESSPYLSLFGIFTVTGVLNTRDTLDREIQDLYTLVVTATDHGIPQLSATASIRIHITDANDNNPEFSRKEYKFTIPENQPRGTRVGQVTASDRDTGDNQRLQYQFAAPQTSFVINTLNGEVTTLESLDRELQEDYTLNIFVTDSGTPQRSDTATIKVKVMDVNDNAPVFTTPDGHRESVPENRPKGIQVMKVVAQDPDAGENGTVSYALTQDGSDSDALACFAVHPTSGWITTDEVLDFETRKNYTLRVVAHDNGSPRQSSHQLIYISVLDDNDEAPLFHAKHVTFDVVENVSIGTAVGVVKAEDKDSGENGRVTYYLVGGNVFSLFAVEPSTGVIQSVRNIDFEESSSHTLSIQAIDNNAIFPQSSNISVTINVIDVNDNEPEFDSDPVFLRLVKENTAVSYVVHTFIATDRDSGPNGTVRYSIASESASGPSPASGRYFNIDAVSGELSVARAIDYERVHTVAVIVSAMDMCHVPTCVLSALVTTVVFVLDVNDNPPVFESQTEVHVFEDEPVGYPLIYVVAVDVDSNQDDSGNNVITYSIVSGNQDGMFRLDPVAGLLTIAEPLDREKKSQYILNITAEDSGVPKMAAYQRLLVSVEDVNDNRPMFDFPRYETSILENKSPGSSVLTVRATDRDEGINGNLTYLIPSGMAGDKFAVDPRGGHITTTVSLDREERSYYVITVYVKDGGYPTLYSMATVNISVNDTNDHEPVFESKQYELQIAENRPQTNIITLVASDLDANANAAITYTIASGNDGSFQIDATTGQLSCKALDREVVDSYSLLVNATDHGQPQKSGSTLLRVRVLDENDNSPRFSELTYTATIPEDVARGHTVMRVLASDPDQGQNGEVAYYLGNDTDGFFTVNSTSGDIVTSGVFDREKNASFVFNLFASDRGGSGPRNATVQIRVTISDVNDNAPVFQYVPYKTSVAQSLGAGMSVLQVRADDPDAGANGSVTYQLLSDSGNSLQYFEIISSSGLIRSKTSLQSALGYHSLLVVATDRGTPALTSTGVAEIVVGSSSPQLQFQSSEYRVDIPENSPVNTTVGRVRANYTGTSTITYSFANGNQYNTFKMQPSTGVIQVADPTLLDYESTPELKLIVSAVADGNHAYASLLVRLTDENDNAPKFAQTTYVSAIWENNKPQTYITQVFARDADSGQNGMVEYSIIDGNTDNVFEVYPPFTGIVRTNIDAPPLDRETLAAYRLVIEAQDRGTPRNRSNCVLFITIVDQNDNPPTFPSDGQGPVYVRENRPPGHLVAVVTATDVDLNPVLVYDFTSQGNPDGAFSVDRSSGTVLLARPLDRESRSHYSVGLQVTDGKTTVTTILEVFVEDENDNAPEFLQQSYQVMMAEQTPAMQSVLTITATDADDGNNAVITYSLVAASLPSFFIDPANGTIYTNKTITSSSAETVVQLVVMARDKGTPPLSSLVAVQVQVAAVNKFRPEFTQSNYTAQVRESVQKGTVILQVSATDADFSRRSDNVHFVLSGPGAAAFYVESTSGRVLVNAALDYEKVKLYDLTVMAIDRGTPPRNSTAPVRIDVINDNDNPPSFVQRRYSVTLAENFTAGQVFLTLQAIDADWPTAAPNDNMEFSITSGNSDGVFFNYKTGGLVVFTQLDYETRAWHRLIIRAVDCALCNSSDPRLSAFVTVDINVTDVNEFWPKFPVTHYYQSVQENQPTGHTVFQAHANDQDGGEYGKVTYSLVPEKDASFFSINPLTGEVTTNRTFDYETELRHTYNITIRAFDPDNRSDTVGVTISTTDDDEYRPKFRQDTYTFTVPGSAKTGRYVGSVAATDQDGGAAGRLVYSLDTPSDYFQVEPLSGNISVALTLHDDVPPGGGEEGLQRRKRAMRYDSEQLTVRVSSGLEASLYSTVSCDIHVDRTCPGCQVPASQTMEGGGLSAVAVAMIVLVCVLVPAVVVVLLLVFYCRRRKRKQPPLPPTHGGGYMSRSNVPGIIAPPADEVKVPTMYKEVLHFRHRGHPNATSSDMSEQSNNSASSGRGSAEVEEEDEEIRQINSNSYLTNSAGFRHKTMPDSGIQQDDDTLSEPSATTHQEYLARLGIDSSKIGKPPVSKVAGGKVGADIAFSVESMHQFSDEGGGEGVVDIDKLTDTEVDEEVAMIDCSSRHLAAGPVGLTGMFHEPGSHQAASLSNVVNSEEEYSGSYNWDYLLDWGPQYQPLAHVFAEIAKLKDESLTPRKQPVKTVPQRRIASGTGLPVPQTRIVPPPLITNAPPPVVEPVAAGSRGSGSSVQVKASGSGGVRQASAPSTSSSGARSQRTSAMNSSVPSLPRSPISYESSYTSPALTPSFTPSLSPLGARTPSISPALSGHTSGHASSAHGSGHNTPGKAVSHIPHHKLHNHPGHRGPPHPGSSNGHVTLSASSDSEREFRI